MYRITKEVSFCYGHRLMHHPGKCRHIHGHSARAVVTLESSSLNTQGMVCDFSDLASVTRHFVDSVLDHNFILHVDDPLVAVLTAMGERFLTVTEHPTAEYLARMIFEAIHAEGLPVVEVTLWETGSASASYRQSAHTCR